MSKVFELSALIHGKFKTDSDFAKELNWPKQKVYKIVNGLKAPSLDEGIEISRCLGVSLEKIAEIFLRYKSPNGDKRS